MSDARESRQPQNLAGRLDAEYASILNDSGRTEAQQVELREAFAAGYDDQVDLWARRATDVRGLGREVREAVLKRRRLSGLADDLTFMPVAA